MTRAGLRVLGARALQALAAVALVAAPLASCHLASGVVPCGATVDCDDGRVCDLAFGVCRDDATGDDAGTEPRDGGRSDAGTLPDAGPRDGGTADGGVDAGSDGGGGAADAGFLDAGFLDAGFLDAGFLDGGLGVDAGFLDAGFLDGGNPPRWLVDVHAVDALPAGASVAVRYDAAALGAAGVRVETADGGDPVPFVFDPAARADAGTTLWLRLPASITAGGHAFFAFQPQAASAPAALDEVFVAGDTFDDATLTSILMDTAGVAFTVAGGRMAVDMSVEAEAAVAYFDVSLARGTPFVARHLVRVTEVLPAGALFRQFAVLQGRAPAATQDNFDHFLRELVVVVRTPEGMQIWCTLPGADLLGWNGTAWIPGFDIQWATPARSDDLEVEIDSDGTTWRVRVRDAAGALLTETSPLTWAELNDPVDAGGPTGPTWVFWGEAFAGPGASFFAGDSSSDWALLRTRAAQEPVVTVTAE